MRNLANSVALKIMHIARAIERSSTPKIEPPAIVKPVPVPVPTDVKTGEPAPDGVLPPLGETPLDQGMTLGGSDSFDSLLGGMK